MKTDEKIISTIAFFTTALLIGGMVISSHSEKMNKRECLDYLARDVLDNKYTCDMFYKYPESSFLEFSGEGKQIKLIPKECVKSYKKEKVSNIGWGIDIDYDRKGEGDGLYMYENWKGEGKSLEL